jgi:hypothetical protein
MIEVDSLTKKPINKGKINNLNLESRKLPKNLPKLQVSGDQLMDETDLSINLKIPSNINLESLNLNNPLV